MEYLSDYSLAYAFDDYLLTTAAPAPNRPEDHSLTLAFNVPIYFRWRQRKDVKKSLRDLAAARNDLDGSRSQTAATVTALYRTALLDAHQAVLYRDSLVPLARQGYRTENSISLNYKTPISKFMACRSRSFSSRTSFWLNG